MTAPSFWLEMIPLPAALTLILTICVLSCRAKLTNSTPRQCNAATKERGPWSFLLPGGCCFFLHLDHVYSLSLPFHRSRVLESCCPKLLREATESYPHHPWGFAAISPALSSALRGPCLTRSVIALPSPGQESTSEAEGI